MLDFLYSIESNFSPVLSVPPLPRAGPECAKSDPCSSVLHSSIELERGNEDYQGQGLDIRTAWKTIMSPIILE